VEKLGATVLLNMENIYNTRICDLKLNQTQILKLQNPFHRAKPGHTRSTGNGCISSRTDEMYIRRIYTYNLKPAKQVKKNVVMCVNYLLCLWPCW
jgi:hypothetical protein